VGGDDENVNGSTFINTWRNGPAQVYARIRGGTPDLGGQYLEMRKFSNLVPMRDLTTGDPEEMALPAGQGVELIGSVRPAATVIATMTEQAREMLGRYRNGQHDA
jgi:NAD(P)H-dependent flavin oxidoreductase YrpB (nitropropane dioxygenase family)